MHICNSQIIHFNYAFQQAQKYTSIPLYEQICSSRISTFSIPSVSTFLGGIPLVRVDHEIFPSCFIRPSTVDENRLIYWEMKGNANDDYTQRARAVVIPPSSLYFQLL